jgi:prevent-host-death family protein
VRKAGIREARQYFSVLINEVKNGEEIVITDRGEPVARLTPYRPLARRPFPGLAEFRSKMPRLDPPLSESLNEDREDRV